MSVFVDDVRHSYGRMVMCHMWADTLDELLAMADLIGVRRKWIQQPPKATWVHFDVSLGAKAKAIKLGAILTDKYGPIEHLAKLDFLSDNPDITARGHRKIEQVARCRALIGAEVS